MSATSVPGVQRSLSRLVGLLKGGQIDKGLDRTAGLARGQRHVDLSVDLHVVEIGAADQRQHLARVCGRMATSAPLDDVVVGQQRHLVGDDALGRVLQRRIERGRAR